MSSVSDIRFALKIAGLDDLMRDGLAGELDDSLLDSLLDEAQRVAVGLLRPLNVVGDRLGAALTDTGVMTADGFPEAYRAWCEGGWNSIEADPGYGGMGLPTALGAATMELWNAANMSFAMCPVLTEGAIEALSAHGSDELKQIYLPRMVSGRWTAAMALTEPSAGSDLSNLRTRAERRSDGTYRVFGAKIFISYGDHDMAENIVHLVLARLPDAPAGTKGISLFLAPKFIPDSAGNLGARNDLYCTGLEHKLGIHASPTCSMTYGDGEGAIAWLVGQENSGLASMFTMMNRARLATGLQGVGIAQAATERSFAYARERRQGRTPDETTAPIIQHPDVQRMLLEMRSLTLAARLLAYSAALAIDRAKREPDEERRACAGARAALLTPLVKAYGADVGVDVASLGIQIHGGMGYVEETGVSQLLRDALIVPIYEGTNGIQAIDLVGRKVIRDDGKAVKSVIKEMSEIHKAATRRPELIQPATLLADGLVVLLDTTQWILQASTQEWQAGAYPYLTLLSTTIAGSLLIKGAISALDDPDGAPADTLAMATHFANSTLIHALAAGAQCRTQGASLQIPGAMSAYS